MFTFPLSPEELFAERAAQMRGWGISADAVRSVRASAKDMWSDAPGGWVYEWTQRAEEAERARRWLEASALYGAAKFPTACTTSRRVALANQVRTYLRASSAFPCRFERREIVVSTAHGTTKAVAHVFSRKSEARGRARPFVCLSGGVDTCKMELHRLAVLLAVGGDVRVAAIDMPGTAESEIPLSPDGHLVYQRVLEELNPEGARTAIVGISFGGFFAAKLGMLGAVDAAVDIGGPVGMQPRGSESLRALPNGMLGIVANALGLDAQPSASDIATLLDGFSLKGLLDSRRRAPMLVINGDKDPYVPVGDTTGFRRIPEATVWMVAGGYHCAAESFPRFVPAMLAWLRCRLYGETAVNRAAYAVGKQWLPRMAT
jgi:esterase FrsA